MCMYTSRANKRTITVFLDENNSRMSYADVYAHRAHCSHSIMCEHHQAHKQQCDDTFDEMKTYKSSAF